MRTEYKQDIHKRYLVVDPRDDVCDSEYKKRMIVENRIEGFLTCTIEHMNNTELYNYEIPKGYISIAEYAGSYYASEELLRRLLSSIASAVMHLYDFLLSPEDILLEIENIFIQPQEGEIRLCYYPFKRKSFDEGCRCLSEELIHCLDHNEKNAVEIGYNFYKACADDGITVERIREIAYMHVKSKESIYADMPRIESSIENGFEETGILEEEKEYGYDFLFENEKSKEKRRGFFARLRDRFGIKRKEKQTEDVIHKQRSEEINIKNKERTVFAGDDSDETVLLKNDFGRTVRAWLVPQNDFGCEAIPVENESCLIGKDVPVEEIKVSGDTVSRIHARLRSKDGIYTITDLGSKNGTSVNGRVLKPGEVCVLHDRDEIAIADRIFIITYCESKNQGVY